MAMPVCILSAEIAISLWLILISVFHYETASTLSVSMLDVVSTNIGLEELPFTLRYYVLNRCHWFVDQKLLGGRRYLFCSYY